MTLTFQQKQSLRNGAVVFYHESKTQLGEDSHILIYVPGKNIQAYFNYIATQENFAIGNLESYGQILHYDIGKMAESEINKHVEKLVASFS